jgi:hypothetical protein
VVAHVTLFDGKGGRKAKSVSEKNKDDDIWNIQIINIFPELMRSEKGRLKLFV